MAEGKPITVDQLKIDIKERLKELAPLMDEYRKLEAAEKVLAEGPPNRGGRPRGRGKTS